MLVVSRSVEGAISLWATHGVTAIVAGHEVRVGKPGFLADVANDVVPADLRGGELAVYVGIDRRYAGVLLVTRL